MQVKTKQKYIYVNVVHRMEKEMKTHSSVLA